MTKNANDVSVTFFALLEILMKSVLPHHAHINQKMNDNSNNIVLRSRSAAEEKKPYNNNTSRAIYQAPPNFKYLENDSSVCQIYLYRCFVHCILCSDEFDTYVLYPILRIGFLNDSAMEKLGLKTFLHF